MKTPLMAILLLLPLISAGQAIEPRWYRLKAMDMEYLKPDWRRKYLATACARVDLLKEIELSKRVAATSRLLRVEVEDGVADDAGKVNGVKVSTFRNDFSDTDPISIDAYFRSKEQCMKTRDEIQANWEAIHRQRKADDSKYR